MNNELTNTKVYNEIEICWEKIVRQLHSVSQSNSHNRYSTLISVLWVRKSFVRIASFFLHHFVLMKSNNFHIEKMAIYFSGISILFVAIFNIYGIYLPLSLWFQYIIECIGSLLLLVLLLGHRKRYNNISYTPKSGRRTVFFSANDSRWYDEMGKVLCIELNRIEGNWNKCWIETNKKGTNSPLMKKRENDISLWISTKFR